MHRQRRLTGNRAASDPFAALGLPARPGLTDDDVRAAWRRIAAATHPDRDDGGDPVRFAVAAAAYAALRTSYGRGEALADLQAPAPHGRPGGTGGVGRPGGTGGPNLSLSLRPSQHFRNFMLFLAAWRSSRRRTLALTLRLLVAAAVCTGALLAAGWSPGTVGVFAGALTWFATTCFRVART